MVPGCMRTTNLPYGVKLCQRADLAALDGRRVRAVATLRIQQVAACPTATPRCRAKVQPNDVAVGPVGRSPSWRRSGRRCRRSRRRSWSRARRARRTRRAQAQAGDEVATCCPPVLLGETRSPGHLERDAADDDVVRASADGVVDDVDGVQPGQASRWCSVRGGRGAIAQAAAGNDRVIVQVDHELRTAWPTPDGACAVGARKPSAGHRRGLQLDRQRAVRWSTRGGCAAA